MRTVQKFTFECLIGRLSEPSHQITWLFVTPTPRQNERNWRSGGHNVIRGPKHAIPFRTHRVQKPPKPPNHPPTEARTQTGPTIGSIWYIITVGRGAGDSQNVFLTFRA